MVYIAAVQHSFMCVRVSQISTTRSVLLFVVARPLTVIGATRAGESRPAPGALAGAVEGVPASSVGAHVSGVLASPVVVMRKKSFRPPIAGLLNKNVCVYHHRIKNAPISGDTKFQDE